MMTKEIIHSEIEKLDDEYLEEVYTLMTHFTYKKPRKKPPALLSKLREIEIDGPEDFAANLDAYTSGEKHARSAVYR